MAYRFYVTDSLKFIAGIEQRYSDIIAARIQDNRTGDEIANDIISRAGLVVN